MEFQNKTLFYKKEVMGKADLTYRSLERQVSFLLTQPNNNYEHFEFFSIFLKSILNYLSSIHEQ